MLDERWPVQAETQPAPETRPGIDCRFSSPILEGRRMGMSWVHRRGGKSRSAVVDDTCQSAPQTCFSFFFFFPPTLRPSTQDGFRAGGSAPCRGAMPNDKVVTKPREARRPAGGANGRTKYRGPWKLCRALPSPLGGVVMACG
jgi:hypothetical protein